ncbi:hypothetical protein JTB14_010415 [Gonioctena quinquepunctata]|nr:hypothetical protein JTB14_010415 [Gonioctena quinquepunctata]
MQNPLVEWMNTQNMVAHNEETTPKLARVAQTSFIDLTLSSQGMTTKVSGSNFFTEENMSLHKTIFLDISISGKQRIDKGTKKRDINQPIWRNEEIATFRAECNRSRRWLIRDRSKQAQRESIEQLEIEYENNRKELRSSMKISQKEQKKLFCDRLGQGYKITVDGLKYARIPYTSSQEKSIEFIKNCSLTMTRSSHST